MNRDKIISLIEQMNKNGLSQKQIADKLNSDGLPTFSGRGVWQRGTVGKLLDKLRSRPADKPDIKPDSGSFKSELPEPDSPDIKLSDKPDVKFSDKPADKSDLILSELAAIHVKLDKLMDAVIKPVIDLPKKPDKPGNIGKWSVQISGGKYRAFRRINGKMRAVFIGRVFDREKAVEKIRRKEAEAGCEPSV